jgi:hypothetical protein
LASISDDKQKFTKLIAEKYGQKEIPFPDLDKLDRPEKKNDEPIGKPSFGSLFSAVARARKPAKE